MKRWIKKLLLILSALIGLLILGIGLYLQQPKFGVLPAGERLDRIQKSPHYTDGKFDNLIPTPQIIGNRSFISASWNYLFAPKNRPAPTDAIPSAKTDLLHLSPTEDLVVWLGHSSYLLQLQGKTILIDPVLSSSAAPIPYVNQAFRGASPYAAADLPAIDYLLISHDHWDHLDYPTVSALRPKIKNVICGLGVGAYFAQWGFDQQTVREADWQTALSLEDDLTIHVLPARHYSGRMLTKNKTLWVGFALTTPNRRLFFSGDSGYGPHFKEIGASFNGFDLVMLDSGQYDQSWPYIHMTPEEAVQAAADLKAKALLPSHIGKFSIANHPWDEPFQRVFTAIQDTNIRLLTPRIGESVDIAKQEQHFSPWWESMY